MADDIIIKDDYGLLGPSQRDQESGLNLGASSRRHPKRTKRQEEMQERLASVREYLADPRPDPQWEKMMQVLSVLLDIFWIIASMAVFHFTDFYVRILYDMRFDRDWLMYSGIAFGIDLAIASYYIIYLTCIKNVAPSGWDAQWRWGFPIATVLFFFAVITFTIAAWKIWWIFTPVILFLFFMGFVTVVSYIPDFSGQPDLGSAPKTSHATHAD